MNNHTKITALATTILLSSSLASPANADEPRTQPVTTVTTELPKIKAALAPLKFEKTAVSTTPASQDPTLEQEFVETSPVETTAPSPVAQVSPVPAPQPTNPTPQTPAPVVAKATPAPAPVKAPVAPASGKGATIAAAAYAQIGISQDCTALATNALAAAGINFHGWPAGYLSLGRTVSAAEAQPGDLAYYQDGGMGLAHIAVYVGNGMAIHGGWNGGTTALFSVNVGSGPVFIRVA